ncbi:unnamed protein product [Dicrocoelium dendriticum]|nr:unnamed protein product [Dicrocoelium dendriticum]
MSVKRSATVSSLSSSGKFIRNICILAHVDHGKTTLADALLATNGIVSLRQAGKLRYMDNTPAEQERGITMKSSVVGLRFTRPPSSKQPESCSFLVNLVDSPGHVDFATEVSTAVRLCDAAIIVVDVIEGVCPQTRSVLRQAWNEQLTLILVLNKIDRLILELQLSCLQGYQVICRVIEQVNSVLAEMFAADIARHRDEDLQLSSKQPASDDIGAISYVISDDLSQTDDSKLYFSPDRGNVVFASAADAWGFRPSDFLTLWSEKLNVSVDELDKFLWGDYYISRSPNEGCGGRTVFKSDAHSNGRKPVFVQLVLEPLWKAYQVGELVS